MMLSLAASTSLQLIHHGRILYPQYCFLLVISSDEWA